MRYGNCKINHNKIRDNTIDNEIILTLIENNAFDEEFMITLKRIDIVHTCSDNSNATLREGKHVNAFDDENTATSEDTNVNAFDVKIIENLCKDT